MKKTDMELQIIRDKLKLLESEPLAGDVLSIPWCSPRPSPFNPSAFGSAATRPRQQVSQKTDPEVGSNTTIQHASASPQAAAIEALKQRSRAQKAQASRADELVSQEIYRLEVHAQNINERSQQQATEILALKRSAQQAALALRRQGIHSHPQLDTIAKFLEPYPSATVPHLERDAQGRFALSHTTVNLHHAEQEALITAETLRNRNSATNAPFSHPVATGPNVDDYLLADGSTDGSIKGLTEGLTEPSRPTRVARKRKQWTVTLGQLFHRLKRHAPAYSAPANHRFSWLDGAIWFSGAAIARILIETIVLNHSMLRMSLLLILFSVISCAIYRVVVAKSSDLTSAFRLGITLLGLFLGGSF